MAQAPASDPLFAVTLIDARGAVSSAEVAAPTQEQARFGFEAKGYTVVACELAEGSQPNALQRLLGARTWGASVDAAAFSQDMATLLQAGITAKEALQVLARKEREVPPRQVMLQVGEWLQQGNSLSQALERSRRFPELLVATVAACERTGDIGAGLSRYANHHKSLQTLRDKVIGACVYPALLLVVGFGIVLLLLGVVVPRFSRLLESDGKELPALSQVLIQWGQFADNNPAVPAVLMGALIASLIVGVQKLRSPQARKAVLSRLPYLSRLAREFEHLQMYRTAAMLTARGLTINQALKYAEELLNPADRARLQAALEAMQEGASISTSLGAAGLSDAVATSILGVAERSGSLPVMLDRIADFYESSLQRNIDVASRLIEPALMIIIGVVIGGIVLLMYMPIFDLAAHIT